MEKILVIFTDIIDELEISGFRVMRKDTYLEYERLAESMTWPFSYTIGDYELEFNSGEDLLSRIETKDLSFEEEKVLKKLFGTSNQFGSFIEESALRDIIGEEDDYDDDEEDENEEDLDRYGYEEDYD